MFYTTMALVMIALMGVSFAPSFYLRWFFDTKDLSGDASLPWHLLLHGTVLTTWFLLFLAQALLVTVRRIDVHRRLGAFGAVLALAVVATSALTTVRAVPRFNAAGVDPGVVTTVVVGDIVSLLQFSIFMVCGVLLRSRSATHKRFMLFASLAIVGPGVFGGSRPITLLQPFVPFPLPLVFLLSTLGALVVHDLITHRRLQPATIWGGLINVLTLIIFGVLLATGAGQNIVGWLE